MKLARGDWPFWTEALTVGGSALPLVLPRALVIGLFAALVTAVDLNVELPSVGIEITPFELAGGTLSVLLVLRTNAGYERWWEGRRLWGGIVNQSRDLVIAALSYGPPDPQWRASLVRWTVVFAHVTRRSLRGERNLPEVAALLGDEQARRIAAAEHMPSFVNRTIADQLGQARDRHALDPFTFLQIDRDRATLNDHLA